MLLSCWLPKSTQVLSLASWLFCCTLHGVRLFLLDYHNLAGWGIRLPSSSRLLDCGMVCCRWSHTGVLGFSGVACIDMACCGSRGTHGHFLRCDRWNCYLGWGDRRGHILETARGFDFSCGDLASWVDLLHDH